MHSVRFGIDRLVFDCLGSRSVTEISGQMNASTVRPSTFCQTCIVNSFHMNMSTLHFDIFSMLFTF